MTDARWHHHVRQRHRLWAGSAARLSGHFMLAFALIGLVVSHPEPTNSGASLTSNPENSATWVQTIRELPVSVRDRLLARHSASGGCHRGASAKRGPVGPRQPVSRSALDRGGVLQQGDQVLEGIAGCGSHADQAAARTDFRSGCRVSSIASAQRALSARARS